MNPATTAPELLPVADIAFRVGVLKSLVRSWIERKALPLAGFTPAEFPGGPRVSLYSLETAKQLARVYHANKAARSKA